MTDITTGSKVQCSNCQEFGHTKVRCKLPPVESDNFDDGGFGASTGDGFDTGGNANGDANWEAGGSGGQGGDSGGW
jgi:hypothetical protein